MPIARRAAGGASRRVTKSRIMPEIESHITLKISLFNSSALSFVVGFCGSRQQPVQTLSFPRITSSEKPSRCRLIRAILAIVLLPLFAPSGFAQPFLSSVMHVSGPGNERPRNLLVDPGGNRYVAGLFTLTAQFDPDSSAAGILTSGGGKDAFLVKYDPSGRMLWARSLRAAGDAIAQGLAVDASGGIWITGHFRGTLDALAPSGAVIGSLPGDTTHTDLFAARYSPAGNLDFLQAIRGDFPGQRNTAIATDGDTAYMVGSFATLDWDDDTSTAPVMAAEEAHAFLLRIEPGGVPAWTRTWGPDSALGVLKALALDVDADGNGRIAIGGAFRGDVDFDPGTDTMVLTSASPLRDDAYVARYDRRGELVWAKRCRADRVRAIELVPGGAIFAAGLFEDTALFEPATGGPISIASAGRNDIFVSAYDPVGDLNWAVTLGDTADDLPSSLMAGSDGRLYLTGGYGPSVLLASLDPAGGALHWLHGLLPGPSVIENSEGEGLGQAPTGEIVLAAYYRDTADVDPGADTTLLPFVGKRDFALATFHPSCDPMEVPTNLTAATDFSPGGQVTLGWDPIGGSIGCKVQGREIGTTDLGGFQENGFEISGIQFPILQLAPNKTWEWQVACACNANPLLVTPWSPFDTFDTDTGAMRPMHGPSQIELIAAAPRVWVALGQSDAARSWQLVAADGRVIDAGRWTGELRIDLTGRSAVMHWFVLSGGPDAGRRSFALRP